MICSDIQRLVDFAVIRLRRHCPTKEHSYDYLEMELKKREKELKERTGRERYHSSD